MTDSFHMDYEDRLRMKDAEIYSLREELDGERRRREAAEQDAYLMSVSVTKALIEFSKLSGGEACAMIDEWKRKGIYG
jgi:hypothetical protein